MHVVMTSCYNVEVTKIPHSNFAIQASYVGLKLETIYINKKISHNTFLQETIYRYHY